MRKARMEIVDEQFNKVMLWDGVRDSSCESFPSLEVIYKAFSSFLLDMDKIHNG